MSTSESENYTFQGNKTTLVKLPIRPYHYFKTAYFKT